MSSFRAADLSDKRALVQTLKGITASQGGQISEEWLLALVRGLRPSAGFQGTTPPTLPRSEEFMTRAVN